MTLELEARKRETTGKGVGALRASGTLPAVVYGAGADTLAIEIDARAFEKALKEAGESTVINLSIDGDVKNVLIHEVDMDPVTNTPRHADFYAIKKGQKVEVEVPVEFTGESPAVKELGANLVKVMHEITVEAEATNLPHEIVIDISVLKTVDDQVLAGDIKLPPGVELITKPEEVVALVAMPEEEKEEVAEVDMASIGISEERGKKEEEAPAAE